MKTIKIIQRTSFLLVIAILSLTQYGCDEFVEVDIPNSQLNSDAVFESASTANAAVADLYGQLRETGFLTGHAQGLSHLLAIYSDEMDSYGGSAGEAFTFYTNNIPASSGMVSSRWNSAYNQIYAANLIIEKVDNSTALSESQKNQFRGEGLFFRAVNHFYLTQLYGDVPLITGTDYMENSTVPRTPAGEVMLSVISDLEESANLLPADYVTADRARVNRFAAMGFLARVYLYNQMWAEAANAASAVINEQGMYTLPSLEGTFLRSSPSTILQLAAAYEGQNTGEGALFIFVSPPPATIALNSALLDAFEPGDNRKLAWTGAVTDGVNTWYYPYKYKERNDTGSSVEYSVLLRLAEQYLIRAEARTMQGELTSAKDDVDVVRNAVGLPGTLANTQADLIDAILQERRVELFSEHGHRFFDLKRTGRINAVLASKPGWSITDVLWPVPQNELLVNPNLAPQNPGY